MERLVIAVAVAVVAVLIAGILRRRRRPPSAGPRLVVPERVERADFRGASAPWLMAVFTAHDCETCGEVWDRVRGLGSETVDAREVRYDVDPDLYERYGVDACPLVIVVDAEGTVRASHHGPVTLEELEESLRRVGAS